jgi:hypothetical protein
MQTSNAHEREEHSGITYRSDLTGPKPQLGDVVRDAMDHAHLIARDTVSLGRLEIEGVIGKAKDEAFVVLEKAKIEGRTLAAKAKAEAEVALVRVAFGAVAAVVGGVGVIFLAIAAFLGLGYLIPSLAARFAIFALVFLATAGIAAAQAVKKHGVPMSRRPPNEKLRHVAPIHPVGGDSM